MQMSILLLLHAVNLLKVNIRETSSKAYFFEYYVVDLPLDV